MNQYEQIENEQLKFIKTHMNTMIKNMDDSLFSKHHMNKDMTTINNIYYAGGTLCVDISSVGLNNKIEKSVICMNISDETIFWIHNDVDKKPKSLMSIPMIWFAFYIYLNVKGNNKYYRECYGSSCIRHLYDLQLSRRKANDFEFSDDLILDMWDFAEDAAKNFK